MGGFFKKYLKPEDPMDWIILVFLLLVAGGALVLLVSFGIQNILKSS